MSCPTLTPGGAFLDTLLRVVDCHARTLGAEGYQALASPNSVVGTLTSIALTLFVAFFGYRMLLGHVPTIRDAVLSIVKIAIVLVLATSWPAYRTLVYDAAIDGPAELMRDIGTANGLPGAEGGMTTRLAAVDKGLSAMTLLGAGIPSIDTQPEALAPFGGFNAFALGSSRILFLISVIGAFAAVRLVVGIALALAPLFALFLLFDTTRGLFEGWVRTLVGGVIGTLAVTLVLGIELALLEPWLTQLIAARIAQTAVPSAPVELLVVTLLFALVLSAVIAASTRLALGFRLPDALPSWSRESSLARSGSATSSTRVIEGTDRETRGRSRALLIADAVAAAQQRDARATALLTGGANRAAIVPTERRQDQAAVVQPLGQSFRRRTVQRVSAQATRREQPR